MKWLNYKTVAVGIVLFCFLALAFLVWLGWTGHAPPWTGFGEYIPSSSTIATPAPATSLNPIEGYQPPKTLWNLLELIVVPLFLGFVAYIFTASQQENGRRIAEDHVRATRMQSYLDQMTELLLEKGLLSSEATAEVRSVARVHTMTTLLELDGTRKGRLLQFLFEAGLIDAGERIPDEVSRSWEETALVSLRKADLRGANLKGAFLSKPAGIDLIEANFEKANMRGVILSEAQLFEANLQKANLRNALLRDTDLRKADLRGADLRGASLRGADLRGANLKGCRRDDKTDLDLT